jgi:integrase
MTDLPESTSRSSRPGSAAIRRRAGSGRLRLERPSTHDRRCRAAGRRSLTKNELQAFFDAADDIVDDEFANGSKRWLPALRDSTAFKVAYAYGLRRREVTMLEYVDFGPNPHVLSHERFGAVQVRGPRAHAGRAPDAARC